MSDLAISEAHNEASHVWARLLETAILAPSPHNVQPWAIRILDDTTAILFMDLQRVLPKEDVTGLFLICTMGTFLEAFSIAAFDAKLSLHYDLLCELPALPSKIRVADELLPFAKLHLTHGTGTPCDFTREDVIRRSTARMAYDDTAIAKDAREGLEDLAAVQGLRFEATENKTAIENITKVNIWAVIHDLNDPNYHDEIAMYFRCGDREEQKHRDGLSSRCMSMSALELSIAKRSPALLLLPGIRNVATANYRRNLVTRCIAWLSGDFWQPEAALHCGQALMRFWLRATQLGLSLHPLGNLVTNHDAAARIRDITGANDIWLIFRLGYAHNVPKSLRRPVADFIR